MKKNKPAWHPIVLISAFFFALGVSAQLLPPKQAYPLNIKQIHSGHSLTDPLFYPNWPGQYVNLVAGKNLLQGWQVVNTMVGKSTMPGSAMKARWETPVSGGAPDARVNIANWELLSITERVPLLYEGGSTQQWYINGIKEQKDYLSLFVNNAWTNGNNGKGCPTLLWTTWTNIDNSNGQWREMLDIQGSEFERMQDYANQNKPAGAPPVYMIPGHKMMGRLFDDIKLGKVPGITKINQFFGDNIHTNELGAYAISMIHYACIFNSSPVGLPRNLIPNAPAGTPIPSDSLAGYIQNMVWDVVTSYPRTGIYKAANVANVVSAASELHIYPNPVEDVLALEMSAFSNSMPYIIMNGTGKVIFEGYITQPKIIISIAHLPAGTYLLSAGSDKKQIFWFIKRRT